MENTKNLLFVQPVLTNYRVPLFEDLSERFSKVTVMAAQAASEFGVDNKSYKFKLIQVSWRRFFGFYNFGFFAYLKVVREHQYLVHFGDFKYLTLYYSLLARLLFGTKVFVHGQGGYKNDGLGKCLAYTALVFMSNGYVAYNEYAANSLKCVLPKFLRGKVSFVNNSLYLEPVSHINENPKMEIAYIGRLREGSNIEMLAQACKAATLRLNIVGLASAEDQQRLLQYHDDIIFHGALFDEALIKTALKDCLAGVYAGDAGLSVVHYMALGLPVVVHSDIRRHMGPEPAYILDMVNGLHFERLNYQTLFEAIFKLKTDNNSRNTIAKSALDFYNGLSKTKMAEGFNKIILSHS